MMKGPKLALIAGIAGLGLLYFTLSNHLLPSFVSQPTAKQSEPLSSDTFQRVFAAVDTKDTDLSSNARGSETWEFENYVGVPLLTTRRAPQSMRKGVTSLVIRADGDVLSSISDPRDSGSEEHDLRGHAISQSKEDIPSENAAKNIINDGPRKPNVTSILQGSSRHIPKIIHQIWKTEYIPHEFGEWAKSWRRNHPDWLYVLWTHQTAENFLKVEYPDSIMLYRSYHGDIYRVDAARFFILYTFGGVYMDLDVESLRPFDDIMANYSCVISQEPVVHGCLIHKRSTSFPCNALMGTRAGHPLFKLLQKRLPETRKGVDVIHSTGPIMLTETIDIYLRKKRNSTSGSRENAVNAGADAPHLPHSDERPTRKSLPPEDQVYLAPGDVFLPTFDVINLASFEKRCQAIRSPNFEKQYDKAPPDVLKKQYQVCEDLIATNFSNKPPPHAYSDHHWVHTYWNPNHFHGRPGKDTYFIKDLIPDVVYGNELYSALKSLRRHSKRSLR